MKRRITAALLALAVGVVGVSAVATLTADAAPKSDSNYTSNY